LASALDERLQGQIARHEFRLLLRPGRAGQSLAELTGVVEAIADHRPDAAELAARAHVQGSIDALILLEPVGD
jgi:DNA-binding GntR family transcriptional regulator